MFPSPAAPSSAQQEGAERADCEEGCGGGADADADCCGGAEAAGCPGRLRGGEGMRWDGCRWGGCSGEDGDVLIFFFGGREKGRETEVSWARARSPGIGMVFALTASPVVGAGVGSPDLKRTWMP